MITTIKVPLPKFVLLAVALPFGSIVSCIIISLWLHKESATATHCHVPNYLPSISAAVGSNTPEIYVWRICIGLHSFLRFVLAYVYYNFYNEATSPSQLYYQYAIKINCVFNILESSGLILLTDVSSSENYEIHKFGFISFIFWSTCHMILTCFLFFKLGNLRYSAKNYRSWKRKMIILGVALLSLIFSGYFFWRHNKFCEKGIYTLFALFEYIFVLSNIAFHGTAMIDFQDISLEIPMHGIAHSGVKKDSWDI